MLIQKDRDEIGDEFKPKTELQKQEEQQTGTEFMNNPEVENEELTISEKDIEKATISAETQKKIWLKTNATRLNKCKKLLRIDKIGGYIIMEDIKCDGKNFHFIYRVAALILNKDKSKVLLYFGNGADFYMLPGGKVKGLETSQKAIVRELSEELGYKKLNLNFVGVNEEIVRGTDFNAHQLTLIYECIFDERIIDNAFKGKDSDYNNFEWIDIENLKNIKTYPKDIYSIIKNDNTINHIVEDIQE